MGTAIVFVYVMIAAFAAPVLWLVWWGLDGLFRPAGMPPTRWVR
jgi:hypothetical protein